MELQAYIPAGVTIAFAVGFVCLFWLLAAVIGPKVTNPVKEMPFECGSEPIGSPRGRYSVKFYQVAILFLVFDIESAFMYPWAVIYKKLSNLPVDGVAQPGGVSIFGFAEMFIFVAILTVALTYVWRKKAIGWD